MTLSIHEFIGLNSLLIICVVLISLLLGGCIKRYRLIYLPESGATLLFGFLVGGILNLASSASADREKQLLAFNSEIVFYVILPPIILDAGYALQRKEFFSNFGTILLYSIFGTIINNLVFSFLLFAVAQSDMIPLDGQNPLECLIFGAIISATDPVATLAVMGTMHAHPLLYSLVFGESVLNDAIAIVLYKTFDSMDPQDNFTFLSFLRGMGLFLGISLGSFFVGISVALLCCFVIKSVDLTHFPVYEFTLVTLFAYLSYFLAETFALSGIMSLFFCSISLAYYNMSNISENSRIATREAYKSLAQIAETFVFAYMGMTAGASIATSSLQWNFLLVTFTILFSFVARACNTFFLSYLANRRRVVQIPFRMMVPIWFAGLRGAVSMALSLNAETEHAKYIISTTLSLVLFTTVLCGGGTLPLLNATGMLNPTTRGRASTERYDDSVQLIKLSASSSVAAINEPVLCQKCLCQTQAAQQQTPTNPVTSVSDDMATSFSSSDSSPTSASFEFVHPAPPPDTPTTSLDTGLDSAALHQTAVVNSSSSSILAVPVQSTGFFGRLEKFDRTFMRKWFGGNSEEEHVFLI